MYKRCVQIGTLLMYENFYICDRLSVSYILGWKFMDVHVNAVFPRIKRILKSNSSFEPIFQHALKTIRLRRNPAFRNRHCKQIADRLRYESHDKFWNRLVQKLGNVHLGPIWPLRFWTNYKTTPSTNNNRYQLSSRLTPEYTIQNTYQKLQ